MEYLPFNKPFIAGKELFYIAQAVLKLHLSGDGPHTKGCHEWLQNKLRCQRALLTHSCTASLEMAGILCDIKDGDEVIMPSFTFVSTANAFVLRGGVPVFVDIREDTLNVNERLIEDAITSRTKAIVPVHYAGVPCEMDTIMNMADKYNLFIIEDAAQALLSSYKGRYLGTIGHLGCLSFHETKNIISGEGGALLVNDNRFTGRSEIIREKGTNRSKFFRGEIDKYTWVDIGSSYLPSELVGAFLLAQLEQAEKIIAARCEIYAQYFNLLHPLQERGIIRLPYLDSECVNNGHIFYIITADIEERTRLIKHLEKGGINAVFHYVPLHSSPAGLKYCRTNGEMVVTDAISDRLLRLPMYFGMTNKDVERVVSTISDFYRIS
ncbi:MAG TPA: dTDP-4-amino-4,6-dideoxygalactose transaminase [Deltaproteobacteria bacterium]|jgi:dTDP-4-amino-4,6-dideoxygalactose transaminase|nr:dTDP-4-amino-4,6-dideoxygalactose transaminase [Deltaproteobacteria bacterium]